jgi:hypothetical protein
LEIGVHLPIVHDFIELDRRNLYSEDSNS